VVAAVGDGGSVARCGWDRRRGLGVGRGLVVVAIVVADAAVAATLATIVVGRHLGGQCVWFTGVGQWFMGVWQQNVSDQYLL
jgi:hypothetical protein